MYALVLSAGALFYDAPYLTHSNLKTTFKYNPLLIFFAEAEQGRVAEDKLMANG